jgi:hypothetical protein
MNPYGVTIGLNNNNVLSAATVQHIVDLGLGSARIQVPWRDIEKSSGVYDFRQYADAYDKLKGKVGITFTIKWPPAFHIVNSFPDPSATAAMAVAMIKQFPDLEAIDFNEDYDNSAGTDFTHNANTLKAVVAAVRPINSKVLILPGCFLQRNSTHITASQNLLLTQVGDILLRWHGHYYTGLPGNGHFDPMDGTVANVPSIVQWIDLFRQANTAHGKSALLGWITEFNFATNTNYGRNPSFICKDAGQQWQYCKAVLDTCKASKIVERIYFFTLGDGVDGMNLTPNGQPTSTYQQLKAYIAQFPTWTTDPPPDPTPDPVPDPVAQALAKLDEAEARIQEAKALLQPA